MSTQKQDGNKQSRAQNNTKERNGYITAKPTLQPKRVKPEQIPKPIDIYTIPPYKGFKTSSIPITQSQIPVPPQRQAPTVSEDLNNYAQTGLTQSNASVNNAPSYCYGNQMEYGANWGYCVGPSTSGKINYEPVSASPLGIPHQHSQTNKCNNLVKPNLDSIYADIENCNAEHASLLPRSDTNYNLLPNGNSSHSETAKLLGRDFEGMTPTLV